MKKKSLFLGMAALLMAGMTSCSSDEIVLTDENNPLEEDQSFFVNINVGSVDAITRADDDLKDPDFDKGDESAEYIDGTANENEVASIYLIFYDTYGNRVSTTQVRRDNLTDFTDGLTDSENSIYKGVVQIDVKHGSYKPAYVMAFINPITSTNFDINPSFETLTELGKTTRPRLIDDSGYFAMSKSVYYRKTGIKDGIEQYEKVVATPITISEDNKNQLFTSKQAALDALGDNNTNNDNDGIVDIYVERYAAKVSFSIKDNATKDVTLSNQSETYEEIEDQLVLTFVPEYWAVNAYESETYITKSFYQDDMTSTLTYGALNLALGSNDSTKMAWKWNNTDYHRSYWAQSPAYYEKKYPRTADDIHDNGTGSYALGYYSYNDIVKNATGKVIDKARKFGEIKKGNDVVITQDAEHPIYVRENTISGQSMRDAYANETESPKASIASVVLVGRYTVKNGDKTIEIGEDEYFYIMGNSTNGYSFYLSNNASGENEMLNYFVGTTIHFAKDEKGENLIFDYTNIGGNRKVETGYGKYFKITHPSKEVRGDLVIDSRFVTIQLDESQITDDGTGTPLYAYIDGQWKQVTKDNITEINTQMLYAAGTAQGFKHGMAYYTIPIKHLGFYRAGNENANKNAGDKDFDWTKVRSGDFGLVRNHSYKITVDNISGLGNGIPDPDDPIVPPTDPEEYYIGARIKILNWAVVPEQNVTL